MTEEVFASSEITETPVRDLTGVTLGDFEVKRLLGRGGMGQVYLATQISLNRSVAIKVLNPRFLSNPVYLARFESEATAVARLNHPNIVHVYTLGVVDQIRFIAMEYVEGTNLREYLERKGALDLPLALSIMRQAGQGIGAAGEVGLVHRDIKPENLLLTRKGRVKIADFGLCRDRDSDRHHVTQPGVTVGTPLYMSPEQAQGRPLDHRSDLYSLGVTFYHMLVGEPPFRADSAVALALKHVSQAPLSLRVHRPEIPVDLERLVLKLMSKSPADRYQSAAEMLADLNKSRMALDPSGGQTSLAEERSITLPRAETQLEPASSGVEESSRPQQGVSGSTASIPLRGIGPWGLALAGLLCLAGGAAAGFLTRPSFLAENERQARLPLPGMDSGWQTIPAQPSAEEQYRFAQFQANPEDQTAAWLAVPGRFPTAHEWISPAYFQLARHFYRSRDVAGLSALKGELAAWPAAKTGDQELVQIVDTAIKLCHKDYEGIIKNIGLVTGLEDRLKGPGRDEPRLYDPGRLAFCVEILADALREIGQSQTSFGVMERDRLVAVSARLQVFLRRVQLREWAGIGR